MQVGMALTPNSLARRKPGVQIPSPPPNLQVRASPASSGRRSLQVAAALRPQAQLAVQPGRLAATRRLGPGPPTMTTERSRRLQSELRVRCGARQSGPASHAGSGTSSSRSPRRQDGQTRAPPGRVAARGTDALHEVTWCGHRGRGTSDTDAGCRTSTPGHWTPVAWTSRARTLDAHTGHRPPDTVHRTPDAWTLTEEADRATKGAAGIRTSGPPRSPTARWTSNYDGSAVRHPSAGDRLPACQATCSVAPSAESRHGALLSSDDYGSSVERTGKLHPLWQVRRGTCSWLPGDDRYGRWSPGGGVDPWMTFGCRLRVYGGCRLWVDVAGARWR